MLNQKRRKHWEKFMVGEIRGKTLGVIGFGDIGRSCAQICKTNTSFDKIRRILQVVQTLVYFFQKI